MRIVCILLVTSTHDTTNKHAKIHFEMIIFMFMIFFTLKYVWQLLQQNLTPTVQLHQFQNSFSKFEFFVCLAQWQKVN